MQTSSYLRTECPTGHEEREEWRNNSKLSAQSFPHRICMKWICSSQLFSFICLSDGLWCEVSTSFLTVLPLGLAFLSLIRLFSSQQLCKEAVDTMQSLKSCLSLNFLHQNYVSSWHYWQQWWAGCCFHYSFYC